MIDRLLENATCSLTKIPTGLEALSSLPPDVIQRFWKLTHAATNALDGARQVKCAPDCERVLASALELSCYLMELATRPRPDHCLQESLTLMSRVLAYNERLVYGLGNSSGSHPLFVMDLNMLFNALERLTGYSPATRAVHGAPSAFPLPQVGSAADWDTMFALRGIAGDAKTWRPTSAYSEFNMLTPIAGPGTPKKSRDGGRNSGELEKYLRWVWSGAKDCEVDELNCWQARAWKDKPLNPSRKLPPDSGYDETEAEEMWFYINGVVTDHWIAQVNAECLAQLFTRPIHILHNPTDGLHRDLVECVQGRITQNTTGVATRVLGEMMEHLNGGKPTRKIVLIAHSQGTIIAAEMVRRLAGTEIVKRMEVFNFAFCADDFPDGCVHQVEHFANENDLVALLSITPSRPPGKPYNFPGEIYLRRDAWGHFLNAHYLDCFPAGVYVDKNGRQHSLLYEYLGGKRYGPVTPRSGTRKPVRRNRVRGPR